MRSLKIINLVLLFHKMPQRWLSKYNLQSLLTSNSEWGTQSESQVFYSRVNFPGLIKHISSGLRAAAKYITDCFFFP